MPELILCGRGGQGIVFLTRRIGTIAAQRGMDVISSETHGMAVRGGSINSHLRIGPFRSPLVRPGHADFIVSLDPSETANNRHYLRDGGLVLENSPQPDEAGVHRVDASKIAREMGRVQLENVVMLGFASTFEGFPVNADDVAEELAADPREKIRDANLIALNKGREAAGG